MKYRVGASHLEETRLNYDGSTDDSGFDDPLYARNESSRRYVTEEPEFYSDVTWLSAPENRKQGSGDAINSALADQWSLTLQGYQALGAELYKDAIIAGICPEQARLLLPAYGLYIRWRWTTSLLAVTHFLNQRLGHDAQSEIQLYAQALHLLVKDIFPVSIKALVPIEFSPL